MTLARTHQGSCHCGAVRHEVDLDLGAGTFKCNCSICTKARSWLAPVKPGAFRILAGNDALTEYTFGPCRVHHFFCSRCGIRIFGRAEGGECAVQVATLDDATPSELIRAPVQYFDGRHDNWSAAPAETAHL